MLRDLPSPLSVSGLRKCSMRTLEISETETSETCLPLDSMQVSGHEDSAFAMTLQNREVIQKNLELLKAEVKKRHFLILFFPPISFTYCKVDNYAFNYQIGILKLAEKPFYEVG